MNRILSLSSLTASAALILFGCNRGEVVRPVEGAMNASMTIERDPSAIRPDSIDSTHPAPARSPSAEALPAFSTAYSQAGRPRIAVFFMRTLSEEVSQWRQSSRIDVSRYLDDAREGSLTGTGRAEAAGSRTTSIAAAGAPAPMGFWDRVREDLFLGHFRPAGVRFVDARVALRKAAADRQAAAPRNPNERDLRTLEMQSLADSADILMEVLSVDWQGREVYYAKAVRLSDDEILATASTVELLAPEPSPQTIPGSSATLPTTSQPRPDPIAHLCGELMRWLAESLPPSGDR